MLVHAWVYWENASLFDHLYRALRVAPQPTIGDMHRMPIINVLSSTRGLYSSKYTVLFLTVGTPKAERAVSLKIANPTRTTLAACFKTSFQIFPAMAHEIGVVQTLRRYEYNSLSSVTDLFSWLSCSVTAHFMSMVTRSHDMYVLWWRMYASLEAPSWWS